MVFVCAECGARRFAHWPDLWVWVKDGQMFCSETCMRMFTPGEKGGKKMASKVTLEQKKKAVEIALGGGNPIPFLKQCGSKSADQMWYAIKRNLEKVDPETYARLTARAENAMAIVSGEARKGEEPVKNVVTCCAPSTRKGVEVPDEIPDAPKTLDGSAWEKYAAPEEMPNVQLTVKAEDLKAVTDAPDVLPEEVNELPQPVVDLMISAEDLKDAPVVTQNIRRLEIPGMKPMISGFDVMALRNTKSGFRYENDEKGGVIIWRDDQGDEVCMTPGAWRDLVDDMGHVLQIFGF